MRGFGSSMSIQKQTHRSLNRDGGSMLCLSAFQLVLSLSVVSSLSETSPVALDHNSCPTLTLLEVTLHLVWRQKLQQLSLFKVKVPPGLLAP